MKRNLDLARAILLHIEADENPGQYKVIGELDGFSQPEVHYHLRLLVDAGLIEGSNRSAPSGGIFFLAGDLTWAGHEFLESSRDEGAWSRAKQLVSAKTGGLSFDIVRALLIELAKRSVMG